MPPLDKLSGQLGPAKAAHLLRRATFGPTPQSIEQFSALNIDQALDILFQNVGEPAPPIDPKTGSTWLNPAANENNSDQEDLIDYFMAWQLELMRSNSASIKERIVWFLHTHMPTRRTLALRSEHLYYQNKLYRNYAFGSFKTIFRKLCIDNAMLIYLDNGTNRYLSPNENFAREMFELYTVGRGNQTDPGNYTNYTEDDIKAAARVLTGYEIDEIFETMDPDTNIPSGNLITELSGTFELAVEHDPEVKQFSQAFQNQTISPMETSGGFATAAAAKDELDKLIDMIFNQDETARFITRKLYRFFVYYKIDESIEENIIVPLATTFKNNNYSLTSLIRTLLGSVHFFDTDNAQTADNNLGAIIKSPLEIIIGTCRMFNVQFPSNTGLLYQTVYQKGLIESVYKQGLELYEPFDVAGYDAYYQFPNFNRNWITPVYLAYRYQFANLIINGVNHNDEDLGIKLNILDWVNSSNNISDPSDADVLVGRLIELLYPFPLKEERITFFIEDIFLDGTYRANWTTDWNAYKNGEPGYESSVKIQLERLLIALMQSPEYQLF
jgi:uncharacterized protein (DUF1800 family)